MWPLAFIDKIEQLEENRFQADDFRVTVVDSNYPLSEIGPSENYVNEAQPRGKEIRLADHATDNPSQQYPAGQTYRCVLEISADEPTASTAAVESVGHEGVLGLEVTVGSLNYLVLCRTEVDAARVIPAELGVPAEAKILTGETVKSHWLDRRHPSRDPEDPSKFYYLLPQNGLMLAIWENGNWLPNRR